jgi:metal-sulfur cluster biosynthetic enzyme
VSTAAILSPFEPIDTATALRKLKTDDRGAIMVLGVFLAMFLIGALWFLIGIGDMLVFRDKAQEAADAAAFSVTVVHAKGMNLIAALNLLMLVMTAIYVALGIVRDVAYIAAVAVCLIPITAVGCPAARQAASAVNQIWVGYSKIFKVGVEALGTVQTVTAYVAPHLGQVAGVNVGNKHVYDEKGFLALSVSSSMIPGTGNGDSGGGGGGGGGAAGAAAEKLDGAKEASSGFSFAGASGKLGLPVSKAENASLCSALFVELGQMITSKFGGGGGLAGKIGNLLKQVGVGRYCSNNDLYGSGGYLFGLLGFNNSTFDSDWWEKKTGPKKMFKPAENGTDWMQTYSFVVTNFDDKSVRQVGMAGYDFTKNSQAGMHFYTAQAEMFFDCKEAWDGDDCNGEDDVDLALYAMNWRTRLVRVRSMNILGVLGDFFLSKVLNGGVFDSIGEKISNSKALENAIGAAAKVGEKVGLNADILEKIVGSGIDKGVDYVEGQAEDLWGGANALPATENYH